MQWLIDIILKLIPASSLFVDRGDVGGIDFTLADFFMDNIWRELDLQAPRVF